ncbi:hypothetical protein D9M73_191270 [compost metagenome]
MSSALARPSWNTRIASLIIGTRIRLTTKPGRLPAVIAVLPRVVAMSSASWWVASLVCRPRMTSIRPITGTGLKKCRPMKRSGWLTLAASWVIDSDEVLEAMTHSLPTCAAICCSTRSFRSRFSVAASMTSCASRRTL